MFDVILIANAIWFALGFHLFAMRSLVFAKILVPKTERDTPVFEMLTATGKFLGGFNFAFCVLSLLVLSVPTAFPGQQATAILFFVFALAHGSQFLANVPIALENRKGGGVWQVKGLMGFIFVTDFTLMVTNFALAAIALLG